MKRFLTVVLMLILSVGVMANGLSLNSIGTRALGMGGAMVGLADDPTAIYWNPAGLIGQETTLSVFVTDIIPFATYKMDLAGIDAKTKTNHYIGPNAFFNYAMDDLSLGLGVFVPAGLGAEWDKADFGFETMSKIGVVCVTPTIAYQLSDQFSVGVSPGLFYGMMEMKRGVDDGSGTGSMAQYEEDISGIGFGATIGLKYNISKQFSLGFTYRTPITVAFEGDATSGPLDMDVERDIEWPSWIGFGAAYHVSDEWTLVFDGQYTDWAALEELDTKSSFTHPLAGPMEVTEVTELKWESQLQIRLGTEYMVNDNFALRGGYYYDPAPSPDETLVILFPSSTNHVVTAGFGYGKDAWSVDFSLEYLLGQERDIEINATNAQPGIHQMDIFAFSIGFGYVLP